jgi:hypothetical protein
MELPICSGIWRSELVFLKRSEGSARCKELSLPSPGSAVGQGQLLSEKQFVFRRSQHESRDKSK